MDDKYRVWSCEKVDAYCQKLFNKRGKMKRKAFSLVELLIVISIIGIMAAIVLPTFQDHTQKAKEASAKDNLRILRTTIEAYAARNNGIPPGYPNNDTSLPPSNMAFTTQLTTGNAYLPKIPTNPFKENGFVQLLNDGDVFPNEAAGAFQWIYKPYTKEIRLDWPGTDSDGIPYFDY